MVNMAEVTNWILIGFAVGVGAVVVGMNYRHQVAQWLEKRSHGSDTSSDAA
ncbi:hypothetical protein [Uliginosibacterium sp. H1]|uniref:hypothetical protein n=1 Tax=Uliginosibacterium sp. H1 TaxID=3114757 RepID=UPI002E16F471|nr:hypothetical protein [Uliginosibacterium sp. H1]